MRILDLFCAVDDSWQEFALGYQRANVAAGSKRRLRAGTLHPSELMTILRLADLPRRCREVKDEATQQVRATSWPAARAGVIWREQVQWAYASQMVDASILTCL
jgi:hypothetical protein